ncbi:hypothetical protein K474DRAFT_870327 [Panus rudis PR-1116 ss-1]|nr:hypothetical protein K474DRAFT_870327 [Panus rudis PR-1116 ss-1]
MSSIRGVQEHVYLANDGGTAYGTEQGAKLLSNFMAPERLALKLGAQVMLIKNMDDLHANGSMGTVVDFSDGNNSVLDEPPPAGKPNAPKAPLGKLWPVVEFISSRRRILIEPEVWKIELPNGEVQASRTQVRQISTKITSVFMSMCSPDSINSILGNVHPQVPRSDIRASQGGSGQSVREGTSIRRPVSSNLSRRSSSSPL